MSRRASAATRNGKTILIRPLEPDDKPLIVDGLKRMSEESRYRRFLTPKPNFTAGELAYLTEVDHRDHEALIAIDPDSGQAVGVARYLRLPGEPQVAEPAVAVIDDWQHLGVGTALLHRLVTRARQEGISYFRPTLLRENRPMLNLLAKSRLSASRAPKPGGPEIEMEFELEPESVWRRLLDALGAAARGELTFKMPRPLDRSRSTEQPRDKWPRRQLRRFRKTDK
jgi:GNAT superfamily N-acetyltransferase